MIVLRHREAIDFATINRVAIAQLSIICKRWLPDGVLHGKEYVARNPTRADNEPGGFRINVVTGKWADFATRDVGGDPISLAAYLFHSGDQIAAAISLKRDALPVKQQTDPFVPLSQVEVADFEMPRQTPRRTDLGDPFSDTLMLPCVIVEQGWRGIRVSVVNVDGGSPHAIASFFKGDEHRAIAEAERYAGAHGFTLVTGVQPEIVVAALEAGIAAGRAQLIY